ncbi:hypothetical protein ACWCQS_31955 [Streptomyces sp. NPDC002076]
MIPYRGRILALQENGPPPYELDGEAHAGELHAIAYYPACDHIRHLMVGPSGRVGRTTRIPMPDAPMVHDLALTGSTWSSSTCRSPSNWSA